MSDVLVRAALVAGMLGGAAVLIALLSGGRARRSTMAPTTLGPGVYLFTSATCLDCVEARGVVTDALGASGFVEVRWEEAAEIFTLLGVEQVPSTVLVSGDGVATIHPGVARAVLGAVDP